MANQNVTQLTQQSGTANTSSLFYAVTGGTTDTGLPLSVLVNSLGLTGTPTAPTATSGTNTTQIASTAFVQTAVGAYAPLTGATFTGATKVAYVNPTFTLNDTTGANSSVIYWQNNGSNTWEIGGNSAAGGNFYIGRFTAGTYVDAPIAINQTTGLVTLSQGIVGGSGSFTTLAASSTVSGTGFSTYLASPPAIGGTAAAAGKFTTLQATSTITPSTTSGIVGTTLADSANAGSVGEYISGTTSGTTITNGTAVNATSISLTAGDWDVTGVAAIVGTTIILSAFAAGVSTTSATLGSFGTYGQIANINGTVTASTQTGDVTLPVVRVNVSTTTTVYLVGSATFSSGTATVNGFLRARRVR
jgi:hypothetical protein